MLTDLILKTACRSPSSRSTPGGSPPKPQPDRRGRAPLRHESRRSSSRRRRGRNLCAQPRHQRLLRSDTVGLQALLRRAQDGAAASRALTGRKDAWITGLRAAGRHPLQPAGTPRTDTANRLEKLNPLSDWSETEVWAYIRLARCPTTPARPVLPSIGCALHPRDRGRRGRPRRTLVVKPEPRNAVSTSRRAGARRQQTRQGRYDRCRPPAPHALTLMPERPDPGRLCPRPSDQPSRR